MLQPHTNQQISIYLKLFTPPTLRYAVRQQPYILAFSAPPPTLDSTKEDFRVEGRD